MTTEEFNAQIESDFDTQKQAIEDLHHNFELKHNEFMTDEFGSQPDIPEPITIPTDADVSPMWNKNFRDAKANPEPTKETSPYYDHNELTYEEFIAAHKPNITENDIASINKAYEFVNNPKHYSLFGTTAIDMIEKTLSTEAYIGFLLGSYLKYACRVGSKPGESMQKDFDKMMWYRKRYDLFVKENTP